MYRREVDMKGLKESSEVVANRINAEALVLIETTVASGTPE